MIQPILMLVITSLLGFLLLRKMNSSQNAQSNNEQKVVESKDSAQKFMGVKDIVDDEFLLTKSNDLITFIKLEPTNYSLLSDAEVSAKDDRVTGIMSSINFSYKLHVLPSPTDIQAFLQDHKILAKETEDFNKKQLLQKEVDILIDLVSANRTEDKRFYISICEKNYEGAKPILREKARTISSALNSAGNSNYTLKTSEIIEFINLLYNPDNSEIFLPDSSSQVTQLY